MTKPPTVQLVPVEGTWWATVTYKRHYFDERGKTPEEAASRLMLLVGNSYHDVGAKDFDAMWNAIGAICVSLKDPDRLRHLR